MSGIVFADDNKEVNHVFRNNVLEYDYVMSDFKSGKVKHSLESKVFGNHYFKGNKPRNNFGESNRKCSLNIKGGFFETLKFDSKDYLGMNKQLEVDSFNSIFQDEEDYETLIKNYEAYAMGESYSNLRCDKSILWLEQSLLKRQFPMREAKASHLFESYANQFRLNPRESYKQYQRNVEIYFLYPKSELSEDDLQKYMQIETGYIHQRVFKSSADDYEVQDLADREYSKSWAEDLQIELVEKRANVRIEMIESAVQNMKDEGDSLYSDSEDYWLEVCLDAIKLYENLERKCNDNGERVIRSFSELDHIARNTVRDRLSDMLKPNCSDILFTSLHVPSKGEKCYQIIKTGKLGLDKKSKLQKLDDRYRNLTGSEEKIKFDLDKEFEDMLTLVRPKTEIHKTLSEVKDELINSVSNSEYLHQLFLKTDGPDFSHIRLNDYEYINPIRPIVNPLDPDNPIIPDVPIPVPGCNPIWSPDLFSIIK